MIVAKAPHWRTLDLRYLDDSRLGSELRTAGLRSGNVRLKLRPGQMPPWSAVQYLRSCEAQLTVSIDCPDERTAAEWQDALHNDWRWDI